MYEVPFFSQAEVPPRVGLSEIDEVPVPEQISMAWSKFQTTLRSADDIHDLAKGCLAVLEL